MNNTSPNDDSAKNYRRHRRLVRIGQAIMAAGTLIALVHWIGHLATNGAPSLLQDILIGYPTGAVLILIGAILAGRAEPGKR